MLLKLNKVLRKIVLVVSAICVVLKLIDKKSNQTTQQHEVFQTEEFDDIW